MLKWLPRIVLFGSIVSVAILSLFSDEPAIEPVDETPSLSSVVPDADRYGSKGGEPPHYQCYFRGEPLAVAWSSLNVTPSVRGYGGPIQILVGMDYDGVIRGVEVLAHNETPVYVAPLMEPWFTEQFRDKRVTDNFEVGEDIDGVTRATVTAEAVSKAVSKGAYVIATEVMEMELPPRSSGSIWHALAQRDSILLLALLLFALAGHVIGSNKLRTVSSIVAFGFVGIYLAAAIALAAVASLLLGRSSGFDAVVEFYLLLAFASIVAILFGRVYCGWICPFGAIYSWIVKLRPTRATIPRNVDRTAKATKYIIASGLIWLVYVSGKTSVANIEPYNTLFSGKGSPAAWVIVAVTIVVGFRIPYMWCRYFCPIGATLGVLSSRTVEKLVPREGSPSCPVNARPDGVVDTAECIRCNGCGRPAKQTESRCG